MSFNNLFKNRRLSLILDWVFIIGLICLLYITKYALILILLLGLLFLNRVLYARRGKANWGEVQSAQNYLKEIYSGKKEYCLILRPFGNDGHFKFANVNAGTVMESLLSSAWNDVIIEQTIERLVKTFDSSVETVALIDPKQGKVPIAPKFICTSNDTWQWVIFDLLKRALWVFVIIPPGTKITDAVIWEINKIMEFGLVGRFALVLPPSGEEEGKRLLEEIKEKLFFISDALDFLEDGTVLIYPNDESQGVFIYNKRNQLPKAVRWRYLKSLPLKKYGELLEKTMHRMHEITNDLPFESRYMHQYQEFSDDDYEMKLSPEYLQLFLRKRIRP